MTVNCVFCIFTTTTRRGVPIVNPHVNGVKGPHICTSMSIYTGLSFPRILLYGEIQKTFRTYVEEAKHLERLERSRIACSRQASKRSYNTVSLQLQFSAFLCSCQQSKMKNKYLQQLLPSVDYGLTTFLTPNPKTKNNRRLRLLSTKCAEEHGATYERHSQDIEERSGNTTTVKILFFLAVIFITSL